jgi:hypothetical protein
VKGVACQGAYALGGAMIGSPKAGLLTSRTKASWATASALANAALSEKEIKFFFWFLFFFVLDLLLRTHG